MGSTTRIGVIALALAVGVVTSACGDRKDDGTTPLAAGELAPLPFGEDTPNLMLTWIDGRGATHVEIAPRDVPPEARKLVRVLVSDREAGTRDPIYVADLEERTEAGHFTARSFSRSAWENEIQRRRGAWQAEAAPPRPPPPALAPDVPGGPGARPAPSALANPLPQGMVVVIYGADWCKPCHQAEDWLRARGVPAVVKDVDKSPEADFEMNEKLKKAGKTAKSIPVIDVAGQILLGFNPRALEAAIGKASAGTML